MNPCLRDYWIAWCAWGVTCLCASWPSLAMAGIRAEPLAVQLFPHRGQQLLVTSDGASEFGASEFDVTRSAEYQTSDSSIVQVAAGGLLQAVSPGETSVLVRVNGEECVVPVVVLGDAHVPPIRFATQVVPVLTKLGCNGGGCHGKATGQNGFKLSLLGFEPAADYETLTQETRGRRILVQAPEHSLLLRKGTARVPHGGGRRLDASSEEYQILRDWMAQGARPDPPQSTEVVQITVQPRQRILPPHATQQLVVTAHLSDGTTADITRQAVYESNEPEVSTVSSTGVVSTGERRGLAAIMVRFGEQIATFQGAVPFATDSVQRSSIQRQLQDLEPHLRWSGNVCDPHVWSQWNRLGVAPSRRADDATYLRRVMVDVCGTLPTREEISCFLQDDRSDKRARLVDRLLERPEYSAYFSLQWAAILRNRGIGLGSPNQRAETTLFKDWIRDALQANRPYHEFVEEILTATGSQEDSPTTVWYRSIRKDSEYVESVAQAFLGVRIQCAQCHHHPADRWSQADYFGLSAAFSRVGRKGGFADGEVPTKEIIFVKDAGTMRHPRTGEILPPKALGGPVFPQGRYVDPRRELARWMTRQDNPFFAQAIVNRMWAHFLGRGLVHPIDDARSTNPPSNPELLDALAQDFIAHGYDLKHLIRVITGCYVYHLEATPSGNNREDTQAYARFYPRRMTAEVLLDGMSQVLQVPTEFPIGDGRFSAGTRAIDLPDQNVSATFLDAFGRSTSGASPCQCETSPMPALGQALELVNSVEIQRKLTCETGYAAQLASRDDPLDLRVAEVFLTVFGRDARPEELRQAVEFLATENNQKLAFRSLLWSLFATNEFLFNH